MPIRALIASFLLTGIALAAEPAGPASRPTKIDLKLLFAGQPSTPRAREFVEFLSRHFASVQAGDIENFTDDQARGFDVVLVDYGGKTFNWPKVKVGDTYSRPTITIGVPGALLCGNLRLKTGYL